MGRILHVKIFYLVESDVQLHTVALKLLRHYQLLNSYFNYATPTYGCAKYEWLKTFLELPNGIPSHDTFARVFAQINLESSLVFVRLGNKVRSPYFFLPFIQYTSSSLCPLVYLNL